MAKPTPAPAPLNLKGTKGNDTLNGGSLGDTINGLQGNDLITGNGGGDTLTGGIGADTFRYLAFADSRAAGGIDRITDFSAAAGDRLDLSALGSAAVRPAYNAFAGGLQAVFAFDAAANVTTLSYYQGSATPLFQVTFTGNVTYSAGAFLGISSPPPFVPPVISLGADFSVDEAAGTISVTVTRTGNLSQASNVQFGFAADGTATVDGASSDVVLPAATLLSFAAGASTATITFDLVDDLIEEGAETLRIVLQDPANATLGDASLTLTIDANDVPPPVLSVADVTVAEGDGTMTFTVTRSGDLSGSSSFQYDVRTVTASTADYFDESDHELVVAFAPGETSKTITVSITEDTLVEGAETVELVLRNVMGATVANGPAIGTITDNDEHPIISFGDDLVVDEDAGTITVTLTRTGDLSQTSFAYWSLGPGSASEGSDYIAGASSLLVFEPGVASASITIEIVDDDIEELAESIVLTIDGVENAAPGDTSLTVTIDANDAPAGMFNPASGDIFF